MRYERALNIEDLRRIAHRRLPKVAYEFLAGGVEDDCSLRANREVFARIRFRPRTLVDVSGRSQQVTVFGKTFNSPFGIAPTGGANLYGFDADIALARAAEAAGVPFVLSTASFTSLEKVAGSAGGTQWFQLYMNRERDLAEKLITRARDAGYEALVVTTDVPVQANREYNQRNGFNVPFKLNFGNAIDGALHPRWLIGNFFRTLLDSGVPRLQNLDIYEGGRIVATSMSEFRAKRESLNWDDLRWVRSIWPRKLLVKGILTPEDALRSLECGAEGIFVSNHGGRQLDGAVSPIEVLPAIRAAVGRKLALMVDSGFRRGADIVKALALGADMVFVGRAPLYGIAAGGEAGAAHALNILRTEVDRVMALLGCPRVADLNPDFLWCPGLLRDAAALYVGRAEQQIRAV